MFGQTIPGPKKRKQNKRRTGRRISSTLRGLPNAKGESEKDTKSERFTFRERRTDQMFNVSIVKRENEPLNLANIVGIGQSCTLKTIKKKIKYSL